MKISVIGIAANKIKTYQVLIWPAKIHWLRDFTTDSLYWGPPQWGQGEQISFLDSGGQRPPPPDLI